MTAPATDYAEYLRSERWATLREAAVVRAEGWCRGK